MKRLIFCIVLATSVLTVGAWTDPGDRGSEAQLANPPGTNESLVVVVAGIRESFASASALRDDTNLAFGELQGFFVDASSNYAVLSDYGRTGRRTQQIECGGDCPDGRSSATSLEPAALEQRKRRSSALGPPASYAVLTGFRTKKGATSFIDLASAVGLDGLQTYRVKKAGSAFIGLGQEAHPSGSGPLLGPLPDAARYQR